MSASTSLNTAQGARDIGYGVVQAITRQVNYATLGIGTADTVKVGTLPSGAQILFAVVYVSTAFNATTTNVLTVGTSSGSDADVIAAGDVDELTTGGYMSYRGGGVAISADTPIYAKYTQTGTAASAGVATITVTYVSTANG